MSHSPVNHPLRPLYRALGLLAGLYLVLFGVLGIVANSGQDFFAAHGQPVLGQNVNLFGSILLLLVGVVVTGAGVLGRNLDTVADKNLAWAVMVIGTYGLATSRTDANFLGFDISTVIVTYIVSLVLLLVGQYTKVGTAEAAHAEELAAHGSR